MLARGEGKMMRIGTVAVIVLLGSAATAGDRVDSAITKHFDCTSKQAGWLARMDGSPEMLAERALHYCREEERALRGLLDRNAIKALQAIAKAANAKLIEQERRLRGWASNTTGREIHCASCGVLPTWDERLRVWRPHGR
jgi:hypothetical protein